MVDYYEDAPDFSHRWPNPIPYPTTDPQLIRQRHRQDNQVGDRIISPIEQWVAGQPQLAVSFVDPNAAPPSPSRSEILEMDAPPAQPALSTAAAGTRNADLQARFEVAKQSRDQSAVRQDRLLLARERDPDSWTPEVMLQYQHERALQTRMQEEVNKTIAALHPHRRPPPRHAQPLFHPSSQAARGARPPAPAINKTASRSPARQGLRHNGSQALLRQHEVPYIARNQPIVASIIGSAIGSATGVLAHTDSAVNAVSQGGFPLIQNRRWYDEVTGSVSAPTSTRTAVSHATRPERSIIHLNPPGEFNAVVVWRRAITCFKAQQYPQALQHFSTILAHPETGGMIPRAHIHYNMGVVGSLVGDVALALRSFNAASKLKPTLALAHFCLGVCLYHTKDVVAALSSFDVALSLFSSSPSLSAAEAIDYHAAGLALRLQHSAVASARELCASNLQFGSLPLFRRDVLFEPVGELAKAETELVSEKKSQEAENGQGQKKGVWGRLKRKMGRASK